MCAPERISSDVNRVTGCFEAGYVGLEVKLKRRRFGKVANDRLTSAEQCVPLETCCGTVTNCAESEKPQWDC